MAHIICLIYLRKGTLNIFWIYTQLYIKNLLKKTSEVRFKLDYPIRGPVIQNIIKNGEQQSIIKSVDLKTIKVEKDNPTYNLFADLTIGKLRDDVRGERVLSAILEFKTTVEKAPAVLEALKRIAEEVNTVISVDIASRFEPDGSLPAESVARAAGLELRPNGKSNLGLGRPRADIS